MRTNWSVGLLRSELARRAPRSALGLVIVSGLALGSLLYGAITSKALRGAGFDTQDGVVDGKKPTAGEKTKISAGVAKLKNDLPGAKDCAKCLDDMCTNGRICTEGGTSTAGATTLPDKKAGCDPKAEAIDVHANAINAPVEVLACILWHEWCHTNQNAAAYAGNFEIPCYEAEIACLKGLGQDQAGTPGKKRYDQMVQCLADLQRPTQVPPKTEPFNAGEIRWDQGALYSISSAIPAFHGIASGLATSFDFPLTMTIPFDFVILHNVLGGSQTVAVVAGLNEPSNLGVIQRLVIQNGQVISELMPRLTLSAVHPFRLASDRSLATVYVLDTAGDKVLRIIDSNADQVPDVVAAMPFATAVGFPQLTSALGISLNSSVSGRPSVFLDFLDTRPLDAMHLDDARTALFDNNFDGVADASAPIGWRDIVAMKPGYLATPHPGDLNVDIFAGTGVPLQVQLTDATGTSNLGVIGNGSVPVGSNEALVNLTQPLQPGEYIRTLDLDNDASVGSFPVCIVSEPSPLFMPSKNTMAWSGSFPGTTFDIAYRRIVGGFDGNFALFTSPDGGSCGSGCGQPFSSYSIGCKGSPPAGGTDMWIVRSRGGACVGTWNEGGNQIGGDRDATLPACP